MPVRDLFELYKPLRNHLRNLALIESLGAIRAYVQHLQFRTRFPSDIEVPDWFLQAGSNVEKKVFEWELDVLTRELLIHASLLDPIDPRDTLTVPREHINPNDSAHLVVVVNQEGAQERSDKRRGHRQQGLLSSEYRRPGYKLTLSKRISLSNGCSTTRYTV